jgi:hypothetical protein
LADLDGNGTRDLLSGSWPGELYWFKRKANASFATPEKLAERFGRNLNVGKASALAIADWDSDGDLDLLVGTIEGHVFFVKNNGTAKKPSFGSGEKLRISPDAADVNAPEGDAGPCVADWDGDGKLDLLLGCGSGEVHFYRNIGTAKTPKLAEPVTLVTAAPKPDKIGKAEFDRPSRPGKRTKPSVADWNGDDRPDLLVGDFHYVRDSGATSKYHGWVWVYLRKPDASTAQAH